MDEASSKHVIVKSQCKYTDQICPLDNVKNDNEHDWWASDSGSSTGSYYSDTNRYLKF